MQKRALAQFCTDAAVDPSSVVSLVEIAVSELRQDQANEQHGYLDRIEALTAGNQSVLISDCPDYYLVAEYLARYSASHIALPLGVRNFKELLNEQRYTNLSGGVLEAAGRIFGKRVRIYVYPAQDAATGKRESLETLRLPNGVQSLFDFLLEKRYVRALDGLPDDQLRVTSDDVLGWLVRGDPRWEDYVDPEVASAIKARGLFGYIGPTA